MLTEQHLASRLPLRVPHWRLNRVTEMLRHRPKPLRLRWADDHSIRCYRRLILNLLAADDCEDKLRAVVTEFPAIYIAHRYHYSPEFRQRQEIEARVLAREPLETIASSLSADPKAIEYYTSVFFDVRDALDHRDWVSLMIRSRMRYEEEIGCTRAEAERGYVMRLFGYFGGSLALDALLNPLAGAKPPDVGDVGAWAEEAVARIVRSMGTAAAATIELTGKNALQLIRLAQRQNPGRQAESGTGDDVNQRIATTLARFEEFGIK